MTGYHQGVLELRHAHPFIPALPRRKSLMDQMMVGLPALKCPVNKHALHSFFTYIKMGHLSSEAAQLVSSHEYSGVDLSYLTHRRPHVLLKIYKVYPYTTCMYIDRGRPYKFSKLHGGCLW